MGDQLPSALRWDDCVRSFLEEDEFLLPMRGRFWVRQILGGLAEKVAPPLSWVNPAKTKHVEPRFQCSSNCNTLQTRGYQRHRVPITPWRGSRMGFRSRNGKDLAPGLSQKGATLCHTCLYPYPCLFLNWFFPLFNLF